MTTQSKDTSVVVVHAADFLEALRCAVIFTDQHVYPGVRVDINPDDQCVEVSARVLNHITATTGAVEWCDIVDEERDLAFELSIKQIRDVLQVFKNYGKRPADEEEQAPRIGIHISETSIRWYDESGLGLSVYLYGCDRRDVDMPPVFHAIDTTMEGTIAEMPVHLTSEQLGDLTKVAKIMGQPLTILGIEPDTAAAINRHAVLCDRFRSIASVPIEQSDDIDEEEQALHFDDKYDAPAAREATALDRAVLHVVTATPTGGIA